MLYSIILILIGSTSLRLFSVPIILEYLFDIFLECFFQFSWVSKVNPNKLKSSTFVIIILFILGTGVLNFFFWHVEPHEFGFGNVKGKFIYF